MGYLQFFFQQISQKIVFKYNGIQTNENIFSKESEGILLRKGQKRDPQLDTSITSA